MPLRIIPINVIANRIQTDVMSTLNDDIQGKLIFTDGEDCSPLGIASF